MAHPTNDETTNPRGSNNRKGKEDKIRIRREESTDLVGLNTNDVDISDSAEATALNIDIEEQQKKKTHPHVTNKSNDTSWENNTSSSLLNGPSNSNSDSDDDLLKGPSNVREPESDTANDLSKGPTEPAPTTDSATSLATGPEDTRETESSTEETAEQERQQGEENAGAGASAGDDPNKSTNQGIVGQIMAEIKKEREDKLKAQNDMSNEFAQARKDREEERRKAEEARNTNNNETTPGASSTDVAPAETETSAETNADPMSDLTVEVSSKEKATMDANAAEEAEGKKMGLMVGRSVGYGARIEQVDGEQEELKITPFGNTEEEMIKNRDEFRAKSHTDAEQRGDIYYTGYIKGYNEGQPQGVQLKREADQAARQKALEEEAKTPEFQAGAALGLACGTASAKGEVQVQASFVVPDGDQEKTVEVQAPLQEVRAKAMDEQQTPNGELKGEALERGFMQHYNAAYGEMSSRSAQAQGPEMDEDYKAGYDNGYKLGKQKALGGKGDPALEAEKESYNNLPDSAPKSEQQKQSGFYMGYNKGMQDARTKNINDQKAAIKARNEDPTFMAGFATGAMQGFLKAMLLPSGISVEEAMLNERKLREGGIPEYFPIPALVRKYLTLVETGAATAEHAESADADKATIAQPLFQDGLLLGFNQGYANAERNRGNFQREQYKMHPDYQDAVKPVHDDIDEKGDKISMTMGHVLAMVNAKVDYLSSKGRLDATQEEELSLYKTAGERLQAEVNKRSEYYERGVLDYYNFHKPKEIKKLQVGDAYAATLTPEYRDGFLRGEDVGIKIVDGKEQLKELHRGGINISDKSKQFNNAIQACHKQAKKEAKKKGQGYFEGYARGYSSKLEEAASSGKSDSGNEGVEDAAKAVEAKESVVIKRLEELGITGSYGSLKDAAKGKKAFEEGAEAGWTALYEQKKSDEGSFDFAKSEKEYKDKATKKYDAYKTTKDDAGNTNEGEAGTLVYYYTEGYSLVGKNEQEFKDAGKDKKFGAPKGFRDGNSFVKGYTSGKEKELSETALKNEARAEKDDKGSKDAYKAGYYAARKKHGYDKFRSAMIRAVNREEASGEISATGGDGVTNRDHTHHAATSDSIADTHALTALRDNTEETAIRERAESGPGMTTSEGEYNATNTQAKGFNDAKLLWIFILGRKYGLPLGEGSEKTIEILQADPSGETITSTFDPTNGEQATSIYNDKENFITGVAQYYGEKHKVEEQKDPTTNEVTQAAVTAEMVKADYEKGYRLAIGDLEKEFNNSVVGTWQHDMGYIDAIKQIAPNVEGVSELEHPSRPILEMGEEQSEATKEAYKQTDSYKAGHGEGVLFGEKLKIGLVNLADHGTNTASDQEYQKGRDKGITDGAKEGEVAWQDPCHPGPTEDEIESKASGSTNYKEGYIKGFLDAYWQKRDFEYGKHLAFERIKVNMDDSSDPDEDAIVREEDAYFRGYNLGRENAAAGRSEDSNGQNGNTEKTDYERLEDTVKKMAQRNSALEAGRELNVLGILPVVFSNTDTLLSQFKDLASAQAAFDSDISELYPPLDINSKEQVSAEKGIQDYLKSLVEEGQETPTVLGDTQHAMIQSMYNEVYQVAYTRALLDFQNLSYVVAMGRSQGHYSGNMSTASQGGVINPGSVSGHQEFQIDNLELIDRFYEVFDIIDDRRYAIEQGIKNIAFYSKLSNMSSAESVAEMQAEIQKLEAEMESDAQEGQEEQLEEYQSTLADASEGNSPFQWKWVEAEERVLSEFKRLHQFLDDQLSFVSPFNTKKGIKDTLGVDLSTSDSGGQGNDVYRRLNLFDNLVLQGTMEYDRDTNFIMSMIGEVELVLDEQNEQAMLLGANIRLERAGFEFTATGLEHSEGDLLLFTGRTITPQLEGGPHEGRALDFEFETLTLSSGDTVKRQVEDQAPALQGG